MGLQIYIDGTWLKKEDARISVFDHGFLYGDGVFEGIRAYNGRVWKLDEHVDRLYDSAIGIYLEIPLSKMEMKEVILETLRRNNLRDAYIRVVVSRGEGDLGLDPRKCPRPCVICITDKIVLYPEELYTHGIKIVSVATKRNVPEALNPRLKSLNYLNNILAKIEANLAGVPEALMLSWDGWVAEGAGDNIFIIKNGVMSTPPAHVGILKGITRDCVWEIAERMNLPVREAFFTRYDVYTADECFLTGTAAEVISVVEVDGRKIGDGKVGSWTRKLTDEFRRLTQQEGTPIYPDSDPAAEAASAVPAASVARATPASPAGPRSRVGTRVGTGGSREGHRR